MVLLVPLDFFLLLLAAASAYILRFSDWAISLKPVAFSLTRSDFFEVSIWAAILGVIIFAFSGLYSHNKNRKFSFDVVRVVMACTIGLSLIALYIVFTQQLFDSRFLILFGYGLAIVYVIAGRLVLRGLKGLFYRLRIGLRHVVLVGSADRIVEMSGALERRPELGYEVVGSYITFGAKQQQELSLLCVDELIVVDPFLSREKMLFLISFCHDRHIVFKYAADQFSSYASHSVAHPLAGFPVVELKRTPLDGWGRVVKRLFDVVVVIILILCTFPFMVLISLLIWIDTRGPVLYKNERVGLRGKIFTAYKFRSMHVKDCTGDQFGESGKKALAKEEKLIAKQNTRSGPIYKVGNDPRVTRVGSVLRRFSLDELPQFFNVLFGTMSLVGPRPHQSREVAGYIDEHRKVFTVKPGVTGLSQISGRSDLLYEDEVRLDVFYIEHWSLFLDIIIFVKTPFILLKRRKAL